MDETAESTPEGRTTRNGVDRTALGYALLFSLPVLVGITVMMLKVTGGRPLALVFAPGLVIGGGVFALVVLATRGGYETK